MWPIMLRKCPLIRSSHMTPATGAVSSNAPICRCFIIPLFIIGITALGSTHTHTHTGIVDKQYCIIVHCRRGTPPPLIRSQRSGQRLLKFMNLKHVCKKSTCTWSKSGILSWFLLSCGTSSFFYAISTVWKIKTLSCDWLKVRIPLSLKMSSANKSTECSRSAHSLDALCWDWVHLSIWVCPGNLEGKTCHHPHS